MMLSSRWLRPLRFLLLLPVAVALALLLRSYSRFSLPEGDLSLSPWCRGGSTVWTVTREPGDPIERGARVVYEMEREGRAYARFGVVRALPGDVVGSREGFLTINDLPIEPLSLRGEAMGRVPEGHYLLLANSPEERLYPDSRTLGFIPDARIRGIIRFVLRG